jgi:hypothetical protein
LDLDREDHRRGASLVAGTSENDEEGLLIDMTTRTEIENVIKEYGGVNRNNLPDWLRNPSGQDGHEFDLAMAVFLHQSYPSVTPVYDSDDQLTAWKGITLKGSPDSPNY